MKINKFYLFETLNSKHTYNKIIKIVSFVSCLLLTINFSISIIIDMIYNVQIKNMTILQATMLGIILIFIDVILIYLGYQIILLFCKLIENLLSKFF